MTAHDELVLIPKITNAPKTKRFKCPNLNIAFMRDMFFAYSFFSLAFEFQRIQNTDIFIFHTAKCAIIARVNVSFIGHHFD